MKKLLTLLLLIGLLASAAAGASASKVKVIRIGSAFSGGYGKPYGTGTLAIIANKGLLEKEFKKDNIKIEWSLFKGAGPATNEALANNTLDLAYIGDLPSIVGKATGLKTKIIAAGSVKQNVYIAIPNDSHITSLKQLKGKKVALYRGTNAELTFNKLIARYGWTERDFKIYNLGQPDGQAALAAKEIDAAVYWNNLINARNLGVGKILLSTRKAPLDYACSGSILVTTKFEKQHPDIVQRIVNVYVKTAKWASEEKHRNAVFKEWAKAGVPFSAVKEDYAGTSLNLISSPILDEYFYNHYKEAEKFLKQRGFIRRDFDVDKWIEPKYLNNALKAQKLENYWPAKDVHGRRKG